MSKKKFQLSKVAKGVYCSSDGRFTVENVNRHLNSRDNNCWVVFDAAKPRRLKGLLRAIPNGEFKKFGEAKDWVTTSKAKPLRTR
jgi:hypothetical protein